EVPKWAPGTYSCKLDPDHPLEEADVLLDPAVPGRGDDIDANATLSSTGGTDAGQITLTTTCPFDGSNGGSATGSFTSVVDDTAHSKKVTVTGTFVARCFNR